MGRGVGKTAVRLGWCGLGWFPGGLLWQRWPLSGAGSCVSLGMSLHCSELSCSAKVCCWTVISTQSWSHHVLSHFLKVLLPRAAFLSSYMLMGSPRMALPFHRAALPPPSPLSTPVPQPSPLQLPFETMPDLGRKGFSSEHPHHCCAAGPRQGRVTVSA